MSSIRPNYPLPVAQPRPQRPEAKAAQRAFFQAAVTQAQPTKATTSADPIRAAAPINRTAAENPEQPQRYLRPGSLVDIKV